jgi:putative addiction module component (TIGR02574 family)
MGPLDPVKNPEQDIKPNGLSIAQKEELLKREADFQSGKIKSEPWEAVKKRFTRQSI